MIVAFHVSVLSGYGEMIVLCTYQCVNLSVQGAEWTKPSLFPHRLLFTSKRPTPASPATWLVTHTVDEEAFRVTTQYFSLLRKYSDENFQLLPPST